MRYAKLFEEAGLMERVLDRELWWPSGEGLLLAAASSRAMLHDQSGDLRRFCPYIPLVRCGGERAQASWSSPECEERGHGRCGRAGRKTPAVPSHGPADAEAAAELEATCFADASHTPWSPQLFMSELASDAAAPRSWWVAHDNGELVGIAGGMAIDTT